MWAEKNRKGKSMKFVGKVIKRESYIDSKGQPKEKISLLDETPDGDCSVQFIEIPGDSSPGAKKGDYLEFQGRIVSAGGSKSFVFPDSNTPVKILKGKTV